MNCEDFERDIYLYSELTLSEKATLDSHLEGCDGCARLFQELKLMHETIGEVADHKTFPAHAAKLTGTIMSRIGNADKAGKLIRQNGFPGWRILKLSMSVASASLVVLFCFESGRDLYQSRKDLPAITTGSVILRATDFHQKAIERQSQVQLFADCRAPFKSKQYFLECARNSMSRIKNN